MNTFLSFLVKNAIQCHLNEFLQLEALRKEVFVS